MVKRNGFSLLEVVVAMAILGVFIFISLSLTMELHKRERELRIDFHQHPQLMAVLARVRHDVVDAVAENPYADPYRGYKNTSQTLVIETLSGVGGSQKVVWDFTTPGLVVRRMYNVGAERVWAARGVALTWNIEPVANPTGNFGVRLTAVDKYGHTSVDQTYFPRAK